MRDFEFEPVTFEKPYEPLRVLFEKAKEKDEFEYACTLLRIRGMEGPGWDALRESSIFVHQAVEMSRAPIDPEFNVRLLLHVYSHTSEIDDLYAVVANMARVCLGERFNMFPLSKVKTPDEWWNTYSCPEPALKTAIILRKAGFDEIASLFELAWIRVIRNAVFHSQYTLFDGCLRLANKSRVRVMRVHEGHSYPELTQIIPINWLVPRIQVAVDILDSVLHLMHEGKTSYTEPKQVMGRYVQNEEYAPITLTVDEYGLNGFTNPPH